MKTTNNTRGSTYPGALYEQTAIAVSRPVGRNKVQVLLLTIAVPTN